MQQKKGTDFVKSLLKKIKTKIEDEGTKALYRQSSNDFTRTRGMSFSSLIYFFLQKGKSSLQYELDEFFNSEQDSYTKSALSQQRMKLKYEVFEELNNLQLEHYYTKHTTIKKWKNKRLVAIDGSTLQLPRSEEIIKDFGIFETRTENNRKVLLGRISQAYDVLNELTIDASIEHYRTSELSLAESHIGALKEGDLLLMDRGYAAFWFMSRLCSERLEFVIRLKESRWKIAKNLLASNKLEENVNIKPSNEAKKRCQEKNISYNNLNLRIIRVPIPQGDDYVLITNLMDTTKYSAQELGNLYRLRWPIEESFKLLKLRGELENLSGKSTLAIKQDFYRIICRANLSRIVTLAMTTRQMEYLNNNRKSDYKINKTQAYRKINIIIQMLYNTHLRKWVRILEKIGYQLANQVEILRPLRKYPINRRYAARPASFMAYKP